MYPRNDMGRARLIVALTALLALAPPAHAARYGFSVSRVTASDLHWSYRPGCPVAAVRSSGSFSSPTGGSTAARIPARSS